MYGYIFSYRYWFCGLGWCLFKTNCQVVVGSTTKKIVVEDCSTLYPSDHKIRILLRFGYVHIVIHNSGIIRGLLDIFIRSE